MVHGPWCCVMHTWDRGMEDTGFFVYLHTDVLNKRGQILSELGGHPNGKITVSITGTSNK